MHNGEYLRVVYSMITATTGHFDFEEFELLLLRVGDWCFDAARAKDPSHARPSLTIRQSVTIT